MRIATDRDWLDAAARLALRARPHARPNPGVSALVVAGGKVVGRGWTAAGGRPHAEAAALAQAGSAARGATLYVTLEPCAHVSARGPACADLIVAAGPARVVIAVTDPDPRTAGAGIARLRAAGIVVDLLASDAAVESLAGYLLRAACGRPHVTLKLAVSLDGAIATAAGESRWITGAEARAHVHTRRALADAIVVGGATWRADAPRLDVRLPGLEARAPMPVVLSRQPLAGVQTIAAPEDIAGLDGVSWLYLEGGAGAAAAFLAADLVERLELYRTPILLGKGRPALGDIGLGALADAHGRWQAVERRVLGRDEYSAYRRMRTKEQPCSPA